ncbi:MAG: transglycosylase SLT domain-containing protein, partial [Bdellovibrionales bacterium]|nr:transglycosylase SLT domain-containing protein [Bdellovibrionales bacterium]
PDVSQPESVTGGTQAIEGPGGTIQHVPYTTAGRAEAFSKLKSELGKDNSPTLAKKITDATFESLDEHQKPTKNLPTFLKTKVQMTFNNRPYHLTFLNRLRPWGKGQRSAFQPSSEPSFYYLQVECLDTSCQTIAFKLSYDSQPKGKPEHITGALFYRSQPTVRLQSSQISEKLHNSAWAEVVSAYEKKNLLADQESLSVVGGLSFSKGTLYTKDPQKILIHYKSDRLSTQFISAIKTQFKLEGDTQELSASTIGNNSQNGALALQVQQPSRASTQEALPIGRIYLKHSDGSDEASNEHPQSSLPEQSSSPQSIVKVESPIIPVPNGASYPSITQISQRMSHYIDDPNVQWAIRVWQGQEKDEVCGKPTSHFTRERAENYFRKVQPVVPFFLAISKEIDVTPEVAYLSVIESQYATQEGNGYLDGEVNGSGSTAAGAFQILDSTAFGIARSYKTSTQQLGFDLPVFKVQNRTLNPNDFRYYPTTSFLAASLLMKENFDVFHTDPALAILAYNQGMGKTAYIQKCAQESQLPNQQVGVSSQSKFDSCMNQYTVPAMKAAFRERHMYFDTTLQDIREYGMGASCEELHYVYGWLALKFIGSNPKSYGFQTPDEMDLKGLEPQIYYPNKPFPLPPVDPKSIAI